MVKEIIQKDNPLLREESREVPISQIVSSKIKRVIENMKKALDAQDDGVAIAAPQIGELWQIFVISGKVTGLLKMQRSADSPEIDFKKIKKTEPDIVYINPKIVRKSKETELMEEGCLSVRWLYGKVRRSTRVTLESYDESGKKIRRGASGLLAQIFQHETDHLKGMLFIDKVRDLEEIPPEKQSQS